MKFLVAFALLALGSQCLAESLVDSDHIWARYKELHGKNYNEMMDQLRKSIFEQELESIIKHNLEYDLGVHSYRLGINQFSDMSRQERLDYVKGLIPSERDNQEVDLHEPSGDMELPSSLDWREKGYVTNVKDQGKCGSCWAFSSVGALEGQHFRKSGKLVSLSPQNLVDCSKEDSNNGCRGGWMDDAFKYVMKNGIDTDESYPYIAKNGICHFNKSSIGATCKGFKKVPEDEKSLQEAVASVGPISVTFDATNPDILSYSGGIYDNPNYLAGLPSHAALVVGYGVENGKDYWLVKDSAGEKWGEKGYIRMVRNKNDQCGLALTAFYPIV